MPRLHVYDRRGLAAHWTGLHGYTNGELPLGTPPEKDIGFPYVTRDITPSESRLINTDMLEFSWAAFNVQKDDRSYADWIDRGRPGPRHDVWADYLRWVAERVALEVEEEELTAIGLKEGRWQLGFASGHTAVADGLVITSPGPPKENIEIRGDSEMIFTGASFWTMDTAAVIREQGQAKGRACVIGSGETAAAIVVHLINQLSRFRIDVVSREGIIYTRGESYEENRLYSEPRNWVRFPETVRSKFVSRTDRGVFSVANKATVNRSDLVEAMTGEVDWIDARDDGLYLGLRNKDPEGPYNLVVDATGFSRDWFLDLMDEETIALLAAALESEQTPPNHCTEASVGQEEMPRPSEKQLIASIDHDLAVQHLEPRLHLPMFAGLAQGPGFPNLGCLGTLSDRILAAHCQSP